MQAEAHKKTSGAIWTSGFWVLLPALLIGASCLELVWNLAPPVVVVPQCLLGLVICVFFLARFQGTRAARKLQRGMNANGKVGGVLVSVRRPPSLAEELNVLTSDQKGVALHSPVSVLFIPWADIASLEVRASKRAGFLSVSLETREQGSLMVVPTRLGGMLLGQESEVRSLFARLDAGRD